MNINYLRLLFLSVMVLGSTGLTCNAAKEKISYTQNTPDEQQLQGKILTGAEQLDKYLPLLKGKRVGLVVNQTSEIKGVLLVDTLKNLGVNIKKIFGPEHGFRGTADAGEKVYNYTDEKTGISVVSLYGAKMAPGKEDLENIDILIFDIQDVGVRFYTYTITMAKVMQSCADNKVPMLILDRPNPNGSLVDGPILDPKFKSGVGMHEIPISHGLTIGEFAQMVNGEGWLNNKIKCELTIIKLANYTHYKKYGLPVKPSPNLPNDLSINLYPTLCLFEGTAISQGRGTLYPFQVLGHPQFKGKYEFNFTPVSIAGMSKTPPLENQVCYGIDFRIKSDLSARTQNKLNIQLLIDLYKQFPEKDKFFNPFFNKLAGTDVLMQQIKDGKTEKEIRSSWAAGLKTYQEKRKKYLLYN